MKNLFTLISMLGFFFFTVFQDISVAQTEKLPDEITIVPFELALFSAERAASQFYGEMEYYDSTTYYDLGGQPAIYAIVMVDLNSQQDPNEIKNNIGFYHKKTKALKDAIKAVDTEDLGGKQKAEKIAELNIQLRKDIEKLRGNDVFATFYCGATEEHVPVIRAHRGLPEHMSLLPELEEEIGADPNLSEKEPGKIIYLGIFDMAYELTPKIIKNENSGLGKQPVREKGFDKDTVFFMFHGKKKLTKFLEIKESIEIQKQKPLTLEQKEMAQVKRDERKSIVQEKWRRLKEMYAQGEGDATRLETPIENPEN